MTKTSKTMPNSGNNSLVFFGTGPVAAAALGAAVSISAVHAQVIQDAPKDITPGVNPSTI